MGWQRLLKGHMGLTQQPLSTEDVLMGVENVSGVSEPTETTLSCNINR